jgi:hypothetical protein
MDLADGCRRDNRDVVRARDKGQTGVGGVKREPRCICGFRTCTARAIKATAGLAL